MKFSFGSVKDSECNKIKEIVYNLHKFQSFLSSYIVRFTEICRVLNEAYKTLKNNRRKLFSTLK